MARYRGLTWDHPRGRLALERAAATATDAAGERLIDWDAQPLEGFEASPIEEVAARYDVIVLDHPHLGDAVAGGAVRPLDTLFPAEFLASVERDAVGPSADSYTLDGRLWALPLDAATQVAVSVPELVPTPPRTWAEVVDLATIAPVAPEPRGTARVPHLRLGVRRARQRAVGRSRSGIRRPGSRGARRSACSPASPVRCPREPPS